VYHHVLLELFESDANIFLAPKYFKPAQWAKTTHQHLREMLVHYLLSKSGHVANQVNAADGYVDDQAMLFRDGEHSPRSAKRGELGSRIGYFKRHGFVDGLAGIGGIRRVGGIGRINGIVDALDGEPCASSWGMCSIHGD
jgi:hypothetical protein